MKTLRILILGFAALTAAHADGGIVCLRQASGPFLITVFASPEPLRVGPFDASVLVQDRTTEAVILDATIMVAIQPPVGKGTRSLTRVTSAHSANKVFQTARFNVTDPGWRALEIEVSRGQSKSVVMTNLQFAPATPRVSMIWPFLLIPPIAIAFFAIHQALRQTERTARR